jgi:hypothetical protein
MINRLLDTILDISKSIYLWAWHIRYSKTRDKRYKEAQNKKIW